MNPLVSIIVCCHNRREYLEQTMRSVFAQNYQPVEIIVMDDGSTDSTPELLEGYGDRIRYYRQSRQGIAVARTNASRLARGELIAYQDDDDLMPQDRITHLYEALQKFPEAVFATGDYVVIDEQGNMTGKRWLSGSLEDSAPPVLINDGAAAILWPKVPAVPHTTLIKTRYGERIDWFDSEFKHACSDADFLARLGRLGPIVYLREVVSYYRRGHSALWGGALLPNVSRLQLWTKHIRLIGSDKQALRRRLRSRMRRALATIAMCESQGDRVEDQDLLRYIEDSVELIGFKERLQLNWYKFAKLPVRNAIYGRSTTQSS